jgi:hypothetical protein
MPYKWLLVVRCDRGAGLLSQMKAQVRVLAAESSVGLELNLAADPAAIPAVPSPPDRAGGLSR